MKRQYYMVAVALFLTAIPFARLFSNGLTISGLDMSQQSQQKITFTIAWNNSWRNQSTSAANWDAAWVIVKFRYCTDPTTNVDPNNNPFYHGIVSTNASDYGSNFTLGSLQATVQDGTPGIDASPNNTGVMLRNATSPSGIVNISSSVTLKI